MIRNKFSLSNTKLLSCDGGELVPVGMFEVLPGDSIQQSTSFLVRASALLAPIMHPISVRVHHWYVPYRIIWDDFEKFITGGPDGMDATVPPTKAFGLVSAGNLADYLGVPLGTYGVNLVHSALPYRAYNMIWNEWYRDQDLETALAISTGNGADVTTAANLQNCSWEKDYFTSSRPWPQKGPTVTLPLGTTAPVVSTGAIPQSRTSTDATMRNTESNSGVGINRQGGTGGLGTLNWGPDGATTTGLRTDLTGASAVNITTFREALALQRYEEARARYGSRYPEYLRYLGVRSSDGRLQRPEYLGGGKQTLQFSEVLQTAPTTSGNTLGVGNLRGHGIAAMRSNKYRRFFEEHGLVMSLMSIRPKTIYSNGLHKMWSRTTKDDYWQKEFEHIGQQEVLNKEVYALHTTRDGVFGYQDRYDEYRRVESTVAGEFRTLLNFWHQAREFSSDPALNATFVKCVPTERTFAVPAEDVYYVHANHSIQARRLVSKTGTSFTF